MKSVALILAIIMTTFTGCFMRNEEHPLPSFNILLTDSVTILNTNQIPVGKPFVLMYFSPDCDHCQREIEDILHHINKVGTTKFYFITGAQFRELKDFNLKYKLTSHTNIIIGRDYQLFMSSHFKATPPFLAIYDKHKNLKAVFAGETKMDKIIEYLKGM